MYQANDYLHSAKLHLSSETIITDYQTIFFYNSSCYSVYKLLIVVAWLCPGRAHGIVREEQRARVGSPPSQTANCKIEARR